MRLRAVGGLLAALFAAGCDTGTQDRAAVSSTRAVMRPNVPVPPGTVPRGTAAAASALAPPDLEPTPDLLARGRDSFLAFCSPCHGTRGAGDGTVVSHGFPRPPSYYEPRLRALGHDHIVGVITHGTGRMLPYAERILPEERWAIAHYVKALQTEVAPAAPPGRAAP